MFHTFHNNVFILWISAVLIRVSCQLTVKGTVNMNINLLTEATARLLKCL